MGPQEPNQKICPQDLRLGGIRLLPKYLSCDVLTSEAVHCQSTGQNSLHQKGNRNITPAGRMSA
jgi:hypothetical protein